MEKATWDEIKALASDFKRTQATSSNQKLTERNWIDIIQYLCNTKQLTLYFTTDGKTFLTPQELEKEIYEELEVSNDRIELTKLSSVIDVELSIIESTVNKMLNNDENLHMVMGNLVNSSYIRKVALKINDIIKEKGRVTILELTQIFELPKVFIELLINNNLNSIIEAHKEGEMLYTNNFIRRYTAMIRGYLTRSSKPVTVSFLSQKFSVSDKVITRIIFDLIQSGRIVGKLDLNKTVFVPDVHLRNQKVYLQSFFQQNNYLDFSTVKEIGIQNAAKFVESEFTNVVILNSCALGEGIISQLEVSLQECERNNSFCDCYQIVPSIVNKQDLQALANKYITNNDKLVLIADGFVVSKAFISKCVSCFENVINTKAEEYVRTNKKALVTILTESTFHDQADEENVKVGEKTAKFKSGGGLQGREIKVKHVKNKYLPDKKQQQNKKVVPESSISFDFVSEEEGVNIMSSKLADGEDVPNELLCEIFQLIEKHLQSSFKDRCKSAILQTSDTAKTKADHQRFEARISGMVNRIRMFERGLAEIDEVSLRADLTRYNLRTICVDVVHAVFEHVARENHCDSSWDSANVTNETKSKLIATVRPDMASALKALNKSTKDTDSFEEFHSAFDSICGLLDLFPKKLDKKAEKLLVQEIGAQYHAIVASKCDDNQQIEPSELLLVALLLIFQKFFTYPIHASGKFVPAIYDFLRSKSTSSAAAVGGGVDWEALKKYQNYVISTIKMQNSLPEEIDSFKQSQEDLHNQIVQLVLNWKNLKNL